MVKGDKIAHVDPSGRTPGVGHCLPTARLCSSWVTCDACWFTQEKAETSGFSKKALAVQTACTHTEFSAGENLCPGDTTATRSQPSRSTVVPQVVKDNESNQRVSHSDRRMSPRWSEVKET